MPPRLRPCLAAALAVAVGCGGARASSDPARDPAAVAPASEAQDPSVATSAWLDGVPAGGTMTYEVDSGAAPGEGGETAPLRVQMEVQSLVRRGGGVAVLLAPVGTPLDDEPIYPRWMVAEEGVLAGLEATAGLTSQAGYAPIDEGGRIVTEAAENVAWRLPREWLTPGRVVAGEEVSAGWRLAERVGDIATPIAGRGCARLEREEAGSRATLLVCANLGVVESASDGAGARRWRLVAVEGPQQERGVDGVALE